MTVIILDGAGETAWDGAAGAFGAGVRHRLALEAGGATVVGLIAPTSLALLRAWTACLDAGLTPIVLHYPTAKLSRSYWQEEIRHAISSVGIDVLLCADAGCVPDTQLPVILLDGIVPLVSEIAVPDALAGDGTILQMSSGTTGHRKGIVFPLAAVRRHVAAYGGSIGLTVEDCVVSWLPLYHDMGFVAAFLMPRLIGCRLVLIDPINWVQRPELLHRAIERHGGTLCYMPNFGFEVMARHRRPVPTVRRWISCSEPTRRDTIMRFADAIGADLDRFANCWGMAENIFAVAQSDGLRTREIDGETVVSCGRPIPGTAVKVVDGQLYVRSDYSLSAYVGGQPIVDDEGFYPTGDVGRVIDGEIYLQGRCRDLVNHGGRKYLLSDLDHRVAEAWPDAAGRLASVVIRDEDLGTEVPVILIEDADFWLRNRDVETLARLGRATGLEAARVVFVPPRFITKTSSGKVNRVRTAQHWLARERHRRGAGDAANLPIAAQAEAEIRSLFPGLDFDRPLDDQLDSLGLVNLSLILAKYQIACDLHEFETVRSVLAAAAGAAATETVDDGAVIKVVLLCDRDPFAGIFGAVLDELTRHYDRPLQIKHLCVPPAPILLSDLIFADYFVMRDGQPDRYASVLSVLRDLRDASLVVVDDLVHFVWPKESMTYPQISHDFRGSPLAPLLGVRWARYSEGHHRIACDLLDGSEILPDQVNVHLDRLASYLDLPVVRLAYGRDRPDVTADWDVQGDGDGKAVAVAGGGRFIDRNALRQQFRAALDRIVPRARHRPGNGKPVVDLTDQPHWCSWVVNRDLVDMVLDRFDTIAVLGKQASVPYLMVEAARRGKRLLYRADLSVPDEAEAVVQTGSANQPMTDKPIFQIMGAGWGKEPGANLPDDELAHFPKARIWSRHGAKAPDFHHAVHQLPDDETSGGATGPRPLNLPLT